MIECVKFPFVFWSAVLILSTIFDCCFKDDYGLSRGVAAEKEGNDSIQLTQLREKPHR
jgi:hypothetical protein